MRKLVVSFALVLTLTFAVSLHAQMLHQRSYGQAIRKFAWFAVELQSHRHVAIAN